MKAVNHCARNSLLNTWQVLILCWADITWYSIFKKFHVESMLDELRMIHDKIMSFRKHASGST
jgi:hypothetical protein